MGAVPDSQEAAIQGQVCAKYLSLVLDQRACCMPGIGRCSLAAVGHSLAHVESTSLIKLQQDCFCQPVCGELRSHVVF